MKRLFLTLVAAAALATPLFPPTEAAAQKGHWEHRGDRGENRGREHRDGGWGRGRWDQDRWNRDDRDGGARRRDHGDRRGDREERWGGHWDDRRFNGYWYNNRWFYGPPPAHYFGSPLYRPGYSNWRRGGRLPPYYSGWFVNDYWRYQLRRPPYGYHWIRIGNDFLLVSDRTSLIFDVIVGGF